MTNNSDKWLQQSALVMRIIGWFLCIGLVAMLFIYPPGFLWGAHPEGFPHIGPAHPTSPHEALHPYLYMLAAMYVALGILLIRGARDPRGQRGPVRLRHPGEPAARPGHDSAVVLLPQRARPPVGRHTRACS